MRHPDEHSRMIDEGDVCYALGVIVYECVSTSMAYEGCSTQQVSQLVQMGAHPDMSSLSPHTGDLFTPIIESCLSVSEALLSDSSPPFSLDTLIAQLSPYLS